MFDHSSEIFDVDPSRAHGVGLWYDADRLTLEGVYLDEVAAYRAKKRWIEALETNFLLEERHDFTIKVRPSQGGVHFNVRCCFLTACGRYAFWRLTHHQAPEVQLVLETSHLPYVESELERCVLHHREGELVEAPLVDPHSRENLYGVPTERGVMKIAEWIRATLTGLSAFGRRRSR